MKLFNKKKEVQESQCECGGNCENLETSKAEMSSDADCYAKVLGSGCAKCNTLSENTKEALSQLGMDTCIQKITDFSEIAKYGVMSTPALVLGKTVVSSGKVLSVDDIKLIISKQ